MAIACYMALRWKRRREAAVTKQKGLAVIPLVGPKHYSLRLFFVTAGEIQMSAGGLGKMDLKPRDNKQFSQDYQQISGYYSYL